MLNRPNSLANIVSSTLRILLGTRCFDVAVLANGTAPAKVKTTAAIQYCINGILYTKAATDDLFVYTDLRVQPVLTTCYYLYCLNASGASVVINGTPMLTSLITADNFPVVPEIPVDANGIPTACPIGIGKVVLAAAATFTPATTSHAAANVTTTYLHTSCMPVNGGSF